MSMHKVQYMNAYSIGQVLTVNHSKQALNLSQSLFCLTQWALVILKQESIQVTDFNAIARNIYYYKNTHVILDPVS